jgi:RNA polymerase sigma-70 factor, ECF subfamily
MSTATLSRVISEPLLEELDRVFCEHYQLVYRTAYGVTGRTEDAEDVLQTLFLRLLRRGLPLDLMKNPKAYLYRAAVNLSLDTIRQRQRDVLSGEMERFEETVESDDANLLEELHKHLYAAIAQLDSDSAHILVLRYVHNYSDAEIAKLLGKSRGGIAIRLFRLRARLKKLICALQDAGGPSDGPSKRPRSGVPPEAGTVGPTLNGESDE